MKIVILIVLFQIQELAPQAITINSTTTIWLRETGGRQLLQTVLYLTTIVCLIITHQSQFERDKFSILYSRQDQVDLGSLHLYRKAFLHQAKKLECNYITR